jgi:choline kinase
LKGVVLAAGPGRRLLPLTESLPKTLLQVTDERTILDLALTNLRTVGIEEVIIVTGFAARRIEERARELERRHGLRIELLFNERAEEWNNAYSLWLARRAFDETVLLVNGDTVHPIAVEEALLAARGPAISIAVDDAKPLGDEAMKVSVSPAGTLARISKEVDLETAAGEYIGVALIEPAAAEPLAAALERIWRRDSSLYYEDGFQEFVEAGGEVAAVSVGPLEWVEVDDPADLERARAIARGL